MENIQKLLCEMQVDFFVLLKIQGQTQQAAASLETIQVLMIFSLWCITHAQCVRYNLQECNWIDYTIIKLVHKIM